jgi:hypothetical protein
MREFATHARDNRGKAKGVIDNAFDRLQRKIDKHFKELEEMVKAGDPVSRRTARVLQDTRGEDFKEQLDALEKIGRKARL